MDAELKNEPAWQPEGVFPATLTPMHEDLSINTALLITHCKWMLANGANGIAFAGTTGEANSLSVAEKMIALDEIVAGGIPVDRIIVGTGCCAFPDSVALTRHAVKHGAAGVLMLPPFYYKSVSDDGIFASFDHVIQRVGDEQLRIYLYHFPKMSRVPFSMRLIERLLKRYPDQIAGVKDSSGDWNNMKTMAEEFPGFRVFAGSEAFLLDILRVGGVGCISASANITFNLAAKVFENWQNEKADELQKYLTSIRLKLQDHVFIPFLKGLMGTYAGDETWNTMRPPHLRVSQNEIAALLRDLASRQFHPPKVNSI